MSRNILLFFFLICGVPVLAQQGTPAASGVKTHPKLPMKVTGQQNHYIESTGPTNIGLLNAPGLSLKMYPNPATDLVHFDFTGVLPEGLTLHIYTVSGAEVNTYLLSSENSIPVNTLEAGTYMYALVRGNGQLVKQGKFQVTR